VVLDDRVVLDVVLRPGAEAMNVARFLVERGLEVINVDDRAVSVQGAPATVERVFGTRLEETTAPPPGVTDAGVLGTGRAFEAIGELEPPAEVAGDVEVVHVVPPPRMF
jgi:hypothetical protein